MRPADRPCRKSTALTSIDLYNWDQLTIEGVKQLGTLPKLQRVTLYDCPQLQSKADEVRTVFSPQVTVEAR